MIDIFIIIDKYFNHNMIKYYKSVCTNIVYQYLMNGYIKKNKGYS